MYLPSLKRELLIGFIGFVCVCFSLAPQRTSAQCTDYVTPCITLPSQPGFTNANPFIEAVGRSLFIRTATGNQPDAGDITIQTGGSGDGDGGDIILRTPNVSDNGGAIRLITQGEDADITASCGLNGNIVMTAGNNGDISFLNGFTGVGTSAPVTRLDVRGNNLVVAPPNTSGLGVDRFISLGEAGGPVGTDCPAYGYRVQRTPFGPDRPISLNAIIREEDNQFIPTISFSGVPNRNRDRFDINELTNRLDFLSAATDGDPACGTRLVSIIDDQVNGEDVVLDVIGEVRANGMILTSDRRLKQNIRDIDDPMDIVMRLRGVRYSMRSEEYPALRLSEKEQIGFIAQEMEEVLPNAVSMTPIGFKGINYDAIIPILTAAIQEQQAQIETQQSQIEELKALVLEKEQSTEPTDLTPSQGTNDFDLNGTQLFQNAPNPFSDATRIAYELPGKVQSADIFVFDMQGKQVRRIAGTANAGRNEITIEAASLEAGMYLYSLIVNGQELDTKRMIITK